VLGAFEGRFDQEMANIHALSKWKDTFDRIVLFDLHNIVFLLEGQQSNDMDSCDSNEIERLAAYRWPSTSVSSAAMILFGRVS